MKLIVIGKLPLSPLCQQWHDALAPMRIRHANRTSTVILTLTDGDHPSLTFSMDAHVCTTTNAPFVPFLISTVTLCYFPGDAIAQAWVAAGWAGFCQHEALELITVGERRPIDPHGADLAHDRGLHVGLPTRLTRETLLAALCVVMDEDAARRLVGV